METGHYTILTSLINGGFLETDGESFWWISEGKYTVIKKSMFTNFIQKKIVYPKRIDDDTTLYYITTESMAIYSKRIRQGNVVNSRKRRIREDAGKRNQQTVNDKKIDSVKNFLNL